MSKPITPAQARKIRAERANAYAQVNYAQAPTKGVDNGAHGRMMELLAASDNSRKTEVAPKGKRDVFIRWKNEQGQSVSKPVERKTSGGRLTQEMVEASSTELIVYSLNVKNDNTRKGRRIIEPIIMPMNLFMEILLTHGSINERTRKNKDTGVTHHEGFGIQAGLKTWYEALKDYPVKFDPNHQYSWQDFEGIEW